MCAWKDLSLHYLDGWISLESICEGERWHLASVVQALETVGIDAQDARAYAQWAFAEHALVRHDEVLLTDAQRARLQTYEEDSR